MKYSEYVPKPLNTIVHYAIDISQNRTGEIVLDFTRAIMILPWLKAKRKILICLLTPLVALPLVISVDDQVKCNICASLRNK